MVGMGKESKIRIIQLVLLFATIITTTIAGAEWIFGKSIYVFSQDGMGINLEYTISDFATGLPFSMSFLFILSVHEFGHYLTARYHQIKTSLPYYIPLPPFPFLIGTLGALIRIRERIPTTTKNFDIGIAGPLAGFVAALIILIYGLINLPPPEYIFSIHPEYQQFGLDYASHVYTPDYLAKVGGADILMGNNLLFKMLANLLADPLRMPNVHEIVHYPLLFAGFLSLFFTALNLLPIGQLDGGHITYGLFGKKVHRWIASSFFLVIIFFAGLGAINPGLGDSMIWKLPLYLAFLYFTCQGLGFDSQSTLITGLTILLLQYLLVIQFPTVTGLPPVYMLFVFLLSKLVGVRHPGAEVEEPLSVERKILGWLALVILVLCFTPTPIDVIPH